MQLEARGPQLRIEHVLELITRLKQLCTVDPASGESAKIEAIRDRLTILRDEGHRALLFSQYVEAPFGVAGIADAIGDFNPLVYAGSMGTSERDRVIARFKSDASHTALVLSLRAGGVGLNLQEASYVFHVDRWWNPAVERQAEDRSHRMGQAVPVTVFKFVCDGTIEERIQQILVQKQQLFDDVVDDVSLDLTTRLTDDELFGLFGLRARESERRDGIRQPGIELEERCAQILGTLGWTVERSGPRQNRGVDLVATKIDEVGLQRTLLVACKDGPRPVDAETVRELLGAVPPYGRAELVLAAPAGVTPEAQQLASARAVRVWDEAFLRTVEARTPGS